MACSANTRRGLFMYTNNIILNERRVSPTAMDRIRIPHYAITNIETFGVSRLAVLQQAQLPISLLQEPRPVISTSQWFALWRALDELNDDPALGLKIGSNIPVDQYDPVFIAGLCAVSFREAINNVARYKQQFCSEDLRIVERDGLWHIDTNWAATQEPTPALLVDGMFAMYMALGQRGSGQALSPKRVRFARKAEHRTLYETYFHCPVDFEAESNGIIFSRQTMEMPFRTFNPDMLALLIPQLEAQLEARSCSTNLELSGQSIVANQTSSETANDAGHCTGTQHQFADITAPASTR